MPQISLPSFESHQSPAPRALDRYALYVQVYGAPIGFRLALLHPERVTALIVQNGNAYAEGQLDLFADYRTNIALYPEFQRFFRARRPPPLVAHSPPAIPQRLTSTNTGGSGRAPPAPAATAPRPQLVAFEEYPLEF